MPLRHACLALIVLITGCTCSEKGMPADVMKSPGGEQPGRPLSPLPVAPSLDVDPQSMPGAGQALSVVVAGPKGAIEGEVRPTITFSRPVKSLEMVEGQRATDAAAPIAKIEPVLEGEWRWLGSSSVEFVPKDLVPFSTAFKVTVLKGLKALDGASLEEDVSFKFETPVLELQDAAPASGFQWLKADQQLMLLVNQPIKDSDLLKAVSIAIEGEASPVQVKLLSGISIQDERREEAKKNRRPYQPMTDEDRGFRNRQMRYTLAPSKPLPLGKRITVTFAPTLKGSEGALPGKPFGDLEYHTYGEFTLVSASMCGNRGSSRCPYGPLVVTTSNEADPASFKDRITFTPSVEIDWDTVSSWAPSSTWELKDQKPTLTIPGKFKPGTRYTVEIAKGGSDLFKQTDARGLKTSVSTDDLSPALIIGGNFGLIEATGESKPLGPA